MAIVNLAINIPDAQIPRVQTALRSRYNVSTNPEASEEFRKEVANYLRTIVLQEERKAATATITEPDAT